MYFYLLNNVYVLAKLFIFVMDLFLEKIWRNSMLDESMTWVIFNSALKLVSLKCVYISSISH